MRKELPNINDVIEGCVCSNLYDVMQKQNGSQKCKQTKKFKSETET